MSEAPLVRVVGSRIPERGRLGRVVRRSGFWVSVALLPTAADSEPGTLPFGAGCVEDASLPPSKVG